MKKFYKKIENITLDRLKDARNMYISCKKANNPAAKYWGNECIKLRKELGA